MFHRDKKPSGADQETIAHYRIVRKLGEGGMGVVYAAHDTRLERPVALKKIRDGSQDLRARERLWREARAAAGVNHPNICQIYEVGEDAGDPYIVMELLAGESLAQRLERGPLSVPEATTIGIQVLTALEALHQKKLHHRDLKPSNVFLTPHGAKVLDFGLARPIVAGAGDISTFGSAPGSPDVTLPGVLVGTPGYMSPEQLTGQEVDHRSDLFAAGALIFEMVAGAPAFSGTSTLEIYHKVCYEQPPVLGGSAAVAAINRVVSRAMSKAPADRYPSAEAMATDLRRILAVDDVSVPVKVRPMSRVIVLPFRLLRPDSEIDFLCFSLAEAITNSLSGLGSLLVRSSITASRFAENPVDLTTVAREAEVDSVLTGTLLRAGDELRVSTQLVEAPGGTVLWSNTAQASLRNIFALEDAITRRVVDSLSAPLSQRDEQRLARDVPASPTAYEFYLRANQQGNSPEHWLVARELFQRSVEVDPNFAPAWARLARCHWLLAKYFPEGEIGNLGRPGEEMARARTALARALDLNPDLPMAHSLQSQIDVGAGRAEEAMERLLIRARDYPASPDIFAGLVVACRFCGLLDASAAAHEQAKALDPSIRTSAVHTYFWARDFDRALALSSTETIFADATMFLEKGDIEEARRRAARLPRDDKHSYLSMWVDLLSCLVNNRLDEVPRIIEHLLARFEDPEGTYYLARILSHAGATDRAREALQQSIDGGFFCHAAFVRDPWLDPIRSRPDVAALLRRAEERSRKARTVFLEQRGDHLLGLMATHVGT